MSILSAIKQQNSSIDDLAKLPQAMIMQMAQKGEIREDMLAPILGRKAEMAESVARTKALQTAGQQQPTVMEQLMATNAQAEQPTMEQSGVAQLPMPERQYAGGGIIAFADGGMSDEDYADYEDEKEFAEALGLQRMMEKMKGMPGKMAELMGSSPKSYEATKSERSTAAHGSHPYEAQVIQEAKRQGVDPNLALHVLYKETGNLKNPESARSKSGAIGVMQLMPGTARELGVDPTDPSQNIAGGISYLKRMYNKYQDPALTAAAYNAGPGRLDKALRADNGLNSLPRETRNYIVGLAEGGEVRHFDDGGYSDLGIPMVTPPDMGNWATITPGTPENLLENKQITPERYKELKEKQKPKKVEEPKITQSNEMPPPPPFSKEPVPESDFAKFSRMLSEEREGIKKSAAEDKNLALLAAGLKMIGGSSPYASVNIGNAGAAGVEQYSASKAKRAAETANLNAQEMKGMYYNQLGKGLEADRLRNDYSKREDTLRTFALNSLGKNNPRFSMLPDDQKSALLQAEINRLKQQDPYFQGLSKQLGIEQAPIVQQNRTIDFSKIK